MSQPTQGPVLKERVWRFIEALLTCAEDSPNFDVGWETDKNTGRPNLVVKTKRRFLENLAQLKKQELTDVIKSLENLQIWDDRRLRRGKGSEIGSFALKLWSTDAQRNREQFEQVWKDSRTEKSKALEANYNKSQHSPEASQSEIDWREVCRTMLEKQKQLTTNRLMRADEMLFDIDRISVDLALVERKQTDKRSGDDNPARSQSYKPDCEETQKLEYKDFLTKVLKSEQSKKVAIIGEPGAGKTTLLQRIAFWILENTDDLPIWIPLGNFPNSAPNFKDYLLNNWLEDAIFSVTPKIEDEFKELLKAGKVWLLLDGVDEMAAKSGSPLTVIANRIVGWCSGLRVVLTCRLNVWEANPYSLNGNGFQTYRTLEFSEEKVEEFIEACFQKSDAELGIQLQQALNQLGKERIKDLVRNPLRLTLLCSTWHLREGKLPDTKAELYQQFVEEVYRWQDKEKEVSTITDKEREQLNAKLKELAVAAIDNETNRFCLRQKFVEDVFGDNSLFQLALNVGWLNQVGVDAKNPHQPVYTFFHPTFQEYFAALAISDWHDFLNHIPHNPEQGTYRIFEPQWKEVILLWLGREDVAKEHKEGLINALVTFEDGWEYFYHYRAYFLAGAGIAEFRDNNSIKGVKEAFINRENAFLKDYVMSVEELSQYRDLFQEMPGTADLQNSSNANDIVANLAILGFGYYEPYRNGRCGFLMPHGIEEARVALQKTDRNRAISLLAWLIPTKQSQVAPNGTYGPNEGTQMDAARLLGKIGTGNETAIKALEWLVQNAQDEHIRRIAVENLRKIDSNNAIARQTLINPIPINQYKEDSIRVTESTEFALHMLFSKIQDFPEEGIRVQAVEKLKEIKLGNKEAAIKALEWLIDSIKDEEIFYHSAVSLGQVDPGNKTASRILVKLIQTHSYDPVVLPLSERLKQNLRGRQYSEVVTELKDYFLKPIVSRGDFRRFLDCYRVIWHCTQNMTYPDFYQAWNPQEGVEQTTTFNSQSLNQADLPQSLQSAIANDPRLSQIIHLIGIDSSKFIDPNNPAAKIYTEMVKRGCPKCDDGTPKTMAELQIYWDLLEIEFDKRVVLVFYTSSIDPTSDKGKATLSPYSETFLSDLSKFGDRICVITNQSFSHIPLKFFTPSHAVEDVMEWIRTID